VSQAASGNIDLPMGARVISRHSGPEQMLSRPRLVTRGGQQPLSVRSSVVGNADMRAWPLAAGDFATDFSQGPQLHAFDVGASFPTTEPVPMPTSNPTIVQRLPSAGMPSPLIRGTDHSQPVALGFAKPVVMRRANLNLVGYHEQSATKAEPGKVSEDFVLESPPHSKALAGSPLEEEDEVEAPASLSSLQSLQAEWELVMQEWKTQEISTRLPARLAPSDMEAGGDGELSSLIEDFKVLEDSVAAKVERAREEERERESLDAQAAAAHAKVSHYLQSVGVMETAQDQEERAFAAQTAQDHDHYNPVRDPEGFQELLYEVVERMGQSAEEQRAQVCCYIWCLLFVLIRQGLWYI